MPFDLTRFLRDDLRPRTVTVRVPEMKSWFGPDDDPAFVIRGLTGEEFYSVREAVQKRADFSAIASRILSGAGDAIADALDEFYGAVPDEFARRVEVLILGCVEPKLDRRAAMRIFKHFPTTAHTIADAILRATGEGSVAGESNGCGETPASSMTSTSATCGENASSR